MTALGYVFDQTVLTGYAQGSLSIASLIVHLDERSVRIAVPMLAHSASAAQLNEQQRDELDSVITNVDMVEVSPLSYLTDSNELADILAATGSIDYPAAHTIAVANHLGLEIVTLDRARWEDVENALPWSLELVELRDD
ncbi:hypothetical protein [Nocardia sp. NPDC004860]|uniref:hypothetical protein n=1 Tax=Nocardia sp. NPDC004860 TaxID=3154557 RepID=UPI0033A8ABA5